MNRICHIAMLLLLFAGSAFAGGITLGSSTDPTPVPTATPTPTPTSTPTPTATPAGGPTYITGGWGSNITAGDSETTCTVSNLNDSGAGSFRACTAGISNKRVIFSTTGTATCTGGNISMGSNVTVDGTTASDPGFTLSGCGLLLHEVTSNIRLKGFRIRNAPTDSIQIGHCTSCSTASRVNWPSSNVHITRMSLDNCGDGNIDITDGSMNVTVDYSILSGCGKNMLTKYSNTRQLTLHHNAMINAASRNPNNSPCPSNANNNGCTAGMASTTSLHFQNNLVYGWGSTGQGSFFECGAIANVIENTFKCNQAGSCPESPTNRKNTAVVNKATGVDGLTSGCSTTNVYMTGNDTLDTGTVVDPDTKNSDASENTRPSPDLSDLSETAATSACNVKGMAGVFPRDTTDTATMATVTVPGC